MRLVEGAIRRLQQAGLGLSRPRPSSLSPAEIALGQQVVDWVRGYLAQPHPELGRSGPVCPFAQAAVTQGSVRVAFDPTAGDSRIRLRGVVLAQAREFIRAVHGAGSGPALDALVLVFPRLGVDRYELLDEIHAEIKTYLMTHDTMASSFHPRSTRPALWNPAFHVLQAPFPAFALRTMDVRDIVFLSHNREALVRYRARFGRLHATGQVSDQHGYATAYADALARFGLPPV